MESNRSCLFSLFIQEIAVQLLMGEGTIWYGLPYFVKAFDSASHQFLPISTDHHEIPLPLQPTSAFISIINTTFHHKICF